MGRMAATNYNAAAGRAIRRARVELDVAQGEFATLIGEVMKTQVRQSTLSGWEKGVRQVPAAALIAASELARLPTDVLLGRTASFDVLRDRLDRLEGRLAGAPIEPQAADRIRKTTRSIRTIVKH